MDYTNYFIIAGGLFVLVFAGILTVWFLQKESVSGKVQSKWAESSSDGSKHVSSHYLFQLTNGKIYSVFWGTRQWDKISEGSTISFNSYGFEIRIFGWRITQPTIFSFKTV